MWRLDAPYEHRKAAAGGIEIVARGRSAVMLLTWLRDLVDAGVSDGR
jgi:hypothetical protein